MQSLGISLTSQKIISTNACLDGLILSHFGGHLPTNWRIFNFGDSYLVPSLKDGVASYLAAVKNLPKADVGTSAALMFGDIITMDKIANSVGFSHLTSATLLKAMRAFNGPAFMEPGTLQCGYSATAPSGCGNQVPVDQWTGTKWSESIVQVGPSLAS